MSKSEFEEALSLYRKNQHRQELIDKNIKESIKILQRLDDLYGITDHDDNLTNYSTIINTTTHSYHHRYKRDKNGNKISNGKFNFKKWSYFPNASSWFHISENISQYGTTKIKEYERLLKRKMRSIARSYAGRDPMFALGYSKIYSSESKSFQFEVDFDERISEINLESVIHKELYDKISNVIKPHIIFSGNRSIYVAFFSKISLPKTTWINFYNSIRKFLIFNGKNDVHTFLGAGLRLPLSRHQSTHDLCRFAHCYTEKEIVDYLFNIEPDDIDESKINELINNIQNYSGRKMEYGNRIIHQSLSIRERNRLKRLTGNADISISEMWNNLHLLDKEEEDPFIDEIEERFSLSLMNAELEPDTEDKFSFASQYNTSFHPLSFSSSLSFIVGGIKLPQNDENYNSEYCVKSINRALYEKMIQNGITYGSSTEILIYSDFVRYCFNRYIPMGKDPVLELEKIISKGISDKNTIKDRLTKLNAMIRLVQNDIRIRRRKKARSPKDMILTEEMIETINIFKKELNSQDKRINQKKYIEALQWIFQMFLYYGPECHIGTEETMEALNLGDKKAASRILSYFQYQFPIMTLKNTHWYDPTGQNGRKQEFELLPSEEWPITIDKKNKKPKNKVFDESFRNWVESKNK
jgi:hypothetical protein